MTDSVMLDWRVPASEWELFREYVEDKYGKLRGYLGTEAELAMRQYTDNDGYNDVEKRVDELVRAAGRTPETVLTNETAPLAEQETTRVTARVDSAVKQEFQKVADQNYDESYGVVFASAINSQRSGGRAARLERKLDRILDDAKGLLSALNESADKSLSRREERTLIICNRLPEKFTDEALQQEIRDVAGPTVIDDYRELVMEHRDVEPHPGIERKPDSDPERLWIPADEAERLRPDGEPAVCRRPVEFLDRGDRVRRLKLELGRRAAERTHGKATVTTTTVASEIFDGEVSGPSAGELMEEAAFAPGYHYDDSGQSTKLRADLNVVKKHDTDLLAEIVEYRDAETEALLDSEPSEETDDWSEEDTTAAEKADAALDALQRAQAATDGGEPAPGDD